MHPDDTQNLLVFSDYISATQVISFLNPLQSSIIEGSARLRMEAHRKPKGIIEPLIESENPSFVVLSRYTWAKAKTLAELARKRRIPVIFHMDDDLLKVPLSLGQQKFDLYNNPESLATLRANMESADILYASTPELAKTFESYDLKVPVISGDLYCTVDPADIREPIWSTMPTIGYMGTGGHSQDLAMILPVIEWLMDEIPFLHFETFGSVAAAPSLARFGGRYVHHEPVFNYAAFMEKLHSLGWWVGLAPLEDIPFNRCKADTKWVEYSLAGAATVASDLPVYHRACANSAGILASSMTDWKDALHSLLLNRDLRMKTVTAAYKKLQNIYTHNALAQQLFDVLQQTREHAKHRAK